MGLSGSRARTQPLDTLQGGAAPPPTKASWDEEGLWQGRAGPCGSWPFSWPLWGLCLLRPPLSPLTCQNQTPVARFLNSLQVN